jgi:hypothetical protein
MMTMMIIDDDDDDDEYKLVWPSGEWAVGDLSGGRRDIEIYNCTKPFIHRGFIVNTRSGHGIPIGLLDV